MTHLHVDTEHSSIIAQTNDIALTPDTPIPVGIKVENMRRRGIDQLEITLPFPEARVDTLRRLGIFGPRKARVSTVTFAEDHVLFIIPELFAAKDIETLAERKDITSIEVQPGTGPFGGSLSITIGEDVLMFGYGLKTPALEWLRERMLLETAGLVSRPLFNVGRRITRKTSNPDHDFYKHWPSGPNRLLSIFLEEFPKHASALGEAIQDKNWTDAAYRSHWMKSSAAAVGAAQLSELCQRMEIDVITDDYSKIEALYGHFEREFEAVRVALTRAINGQPDACASFAPQPEPDAVENATVGLEGRKILVVEDSLVNQEVARFSLEEAGCETFVASDGQVAVDMFQQDTYDLILMDCQMPGMDGYDATRAIRTIESLNFLPPTPIIALTANALKDDREACMSAGMHDYLSKPYDDCDLMEILMKWLPDQSLFDEPSPEAEST